METTHIGILYHNIQDSSTHTVQVMHEMPVSKA